MVELARGAGGIMSWWTQGVRLACAVGLLALLVSGDPPRAAETTQYSYDGLGRVTSAIDASGRKVAYTYDAAGNRTRVSNGAEFTESLPAAWSASSNAGTTGLSSANGLRDGDFHSLASIHATQVEANPWIQADLGSVKAVNHIDIAAAVASAVGAGPEDLNDTVIQYSTDGASWNSGPTLYSMPPSGARTVVLGGVALRYLRVRRTLAGQVALGDLRFFSAAAANSSLIAEPDAITTAGAPVTFDPRLNDRDLDAQSFSIVTVEAPAHGVAVINGGMSLTYTPASGYFGADGFTYTVADGHNGLATARVSVLVRSSVNHTPVAVGDSFAIGDRLSAAVDGTQSLRPINNDYDADGDVLTITGATAPVHGSISLVGSNVITYQPAAAFDGSDSFTYTISDGRGGTSAATVSLAVANAPPIAGPDNVTVAHNASVTFDPRLNDSDPNGDALSVTAVATPGHGTAILNPDQTVTYTPASTSGPVSDSFTYDLTDPRGGVATGWITVAIAPNRAPAAQTDYITASASSMTFDPRANDTDADSDALTVVSVTAPGHGTAAIASPGATVTYTPAAGYSGTDSFAYTVSDPQGATSTATVWVNGLAGDYLIVAGGGGGGAGAAIAQLGGGGGGGGVLVGSAILASGSYSISVGSGGAGGAPGATTGATGGNSAAFGFTASGGGGGAGYGATPGNGASGGGSTSPAQAGGTAVTGQGHAGGTSDASNHGAGGGGGGAAGSADGTGGQGVSSAISGTSTVYASGGGGGGFCFVGHYWSAHGGANGGDAMSCGSGGAGLYGGGGGGGSSTSDPDDGDIVGVGGAGGGGRVVIRYPGTPRATGGTITQSGGNTIHTFTSGGTLVVP
jgi:YD repeat-containing protein